MTNTDVCDIKGCTERAYREIMIKANYWLGDKIIKIDICSKHETEILKLMGFDGEYKAQDYFENQWRKRD